MKLKELLVGIDILEQNAEDIYITGVTCDSRQVQPGNLFVAISGNAADGNKYIPMALEKGAAVIVTAKRPEGQVPYVLVASDRMALAQLGANFYGHPADSLTLVGITGTNGKTSTALLLQQVIKKVTGQKVGLIGTVENCLGDETVPAERTTPQSVELQEMFAKMREAGCKYAVMEVSSHAIDQERIGGIRFRVAAFTNLTQDHLDYHKTMENYCDTKAKLFTRCDRAVVNGDDPWKDRILADCRVSVIAASAEGKADLYAENMQLHSDSVTFTAVYGEEREEVCVPIPGKFTVYNALTVLGCVLQLDIPLKAAAEALKTVSGVKGRVEVVPTPGKDYTILIDYAHTPDGLENVLSSVKGFCKGRLIAVFGCGGDRDPVKRPIMGAIGVKYADLAVITSDNPRTEVPGAIISDIVKGLGSAENYKVIENRPKAIEYAMDIAKKDDIIVLAGKGHETYQEIMGIKHYLDEREVVQAILQK